VAYNPEFMREGSAVADFLEPEYTVLGSQNYAHLEVLRELYKSTPGKIFETTIPVAGMVKYLSNAFHAVKVSFANEMGTLCKRPEQIVIDLVHLDKAQRPGGTSAYEGICW